MKISSAPQSLCPADAPTTTRDMSAVSAPARGWLIWLVVIPPANRSGMLAKGYKTFSKSSTPRVTRAVVVGI